MDISIPALQPKEPKPRVSGDLAQQRDLQPAHGLLSAMLAGWVASSVESNTIVFLFPLSPADINSGGSSQ